MPPSKKLTLEQKKKLDATKRQWLAKRKACGPTSDKLPEQLSSSSRDTSGNVQRSNGKALRLKEDEDSKKFGSEPIHQGAASSQTFVLGDLFVSENQPHAQPQPLPRLNPGGHRSGEGSQARNYRLQRNASQATDANSALPEWRRNNARPSQKTGEKSEDKLSKLDKDLTLALANYERRASTNRRMAAAPPDATWAIVDNSPIDDFHDRIPDMPIQFPFELDNFQKRAILHLEMQRSVFVAAHTSAGKTVIAEYAIALAASFGTKVFYTSPIKTLSNQKLRDFRKKFDDVGLVTGDVSINEDAQCVIMTTEILRSMLYRGADVIRDVSYVVFDEVQFLNDEERGVVWEESIIMLPPHIGIIMLSATVPNALQFAAWVGKTKDRQVAVVTTDKRPIPLEHSLLLRGGDEPDNLMKQTLLEQGGSFMLDQCHTAVKSMTRRKEEDKQQRQKDGRKEKQLRRTNELHAGKSEQTVSMVDPTSGLLEGRSSREGNERKEPPKGRNRNKGASTKAAKSATAGQGRGPGRGPNSRCSPWIPLVRFLDNRNETPTVVFCFSKKGCERAVESLEAYDLLPNKEDKSYVHRFFEKAVGRLREEDRNLPQVLRVQENLKRGISAHHAGLLPLVKEVTEILFSMGYVKVLFATETFAMGVNMPARTVVFSSVRKNDGKRFRSLEPGEYTQMSGRAGRRGLDSIGHVYLFFPPENGVPDPRQLKHVLTGRPSSLESQFRLTYNMILNVLRVDELRVEEMMKRSFSEATAGSTTEDIGKVLGKAGDTLKILKDSEDVMKSTVSIEQDIPADSGFGQIIEHLSNLDDLSAQLTHQHLNPIFGKHMTPGRVVIVKAENSKMMLSVVFCVVSKSSPPNVCPETSIWVASIVGIEPGAFPKPHLPSVLLLPDSFSQGKWTRNRGVRGYPFITTGDGLVVGLQLVKASDIVYICNETEELSNSRKAEQHHASKAWHFNHRNDLARKCLFKIGRYLGDLVHELRKRYLSCDEDLKKAFFKEVTVDSRKSQSGRSDGQCPRTPSRAPAVYKERASLVLGIVSSESIFYTIQAEAGASGNNCVDKMSSILLHRKISKKMARLKAVQETGSQPSLLPEYQNRVKLLQSLQYVGTDGLSVQLKGRCACEVTTVDSVVLTEIILENVLLDLQPAEIASLLSCFVCRKKNVAEIHARDGRKYRPEYISAKAKLRSVVQKVGNLQTECGVEMDVFVADGGDDFEGGVCRWDLAEAVYEWAKGEPFCNITNLTEQQEGDIVVCVKRLSELLRDAQGVSKGIGNVELVELLEDAITAIRRDVIFNGSLYYES